MRVLVTGCEGMLGRSVVQNWRTTDDIVGVSRSNGDLTDPGFASRLLSRHRPDWVVHCAAWTDVDGAETAKEYATAANTDATVYLGAACEETGAGITLISTDYVFDGGAPGGYVEDQPRHPVNHYGLTKAQAEESVENLVTPWQIVRTSWLFGDGKANFVKTIRRLLGERETLRVVVDQLGCPTYVDDLAAVLEFLVVNRRQGIFHGTNQGATTWHELAQEVALCLGQDPARIEPCSSSEYATVARRPACSVLLDLRLGAAGCPPSPAWPDAVARYVARLENGGVVFP